MPPLYSHLGTTGVYVYATDFDIPGRSATIHAESEVRYEPRQDRTFTYEVTIEDRDGRIVKQFSLGASDARDAFTMAELNDQANAATDSDRLAARTLSIVEAEFCANP